MAGNSKQKLKLLYLKEFLERQTDENSGVTMEQIIDYLEGWGITTERKSIYSDIERLREYGMDIVAKKGGRTEYKLISREFQLAELKLLVDAVGASRFITRKKSLELIKKLESLTSANEARGLRRQVFVDKRVKTMNESIYYNVDTIHEAINLNRKLKFKYFGYSREKSRVFRRDGEFYIASPLALLYSDENYYLAAYSDSRAMLVNYRVDRMTEVSLVDIPRQLGEDVKKFDPVEYLNSQFSMYGGEKERVEILFDNSLTTVVIDRFGTDISMRPADAEHFTISVDVEVSPAFLSWVFMFGSRAYISGPRSVVEEFARMARSIAEGYPETFD